MLETAFSRQPQTAAVINALARLLATAPASDVRDGKRALEMAMSLFEANSTLEIGQTYAMALAESGNFTKAAELQQEIISAYERSGIPVDKFFVAQNLAAYLRNEPVRDGWSTEDPVSGRVALLLRLPDDDVVKEPPKLQLRATARPSTTIKGQIYVR